jgi:Undecaprenyl-phosphate galactose phosphotransferase WbaP
MSSAVAAIHRQQSARLRDDPPCRPGLSAAAIITSDVAVLTFAAIFGFLIEACLRGSATTHSFFFLLGLMTLFPLAYAGAGLYPGISVQPVKELRCATSTASITYITLAITAMLLRHSNTANQIALATSCSTLIVFVPLSRCWTRKALSRQPWWGCPVIVFGAPHTVSSVVTKLQEQKECGLKPIAIVSSDRGCGELHGIPLLDLQNALEVLDKTRAQHAIVVAPGVLRQVITNLFGDLLCRFPYVSIVHDLEDICSLRVEARELGQMISIGLSEPLLLRGPQILKRAMDLLIASTLLTLCAPLIGLLMLLIRLDSAGPTLFRQVRVGRGGRAFRVWKFRSMVVDSDRVLRAHLKACESAALEWNSTRKLTLDPRITRIGRLLRRSSLDELPQLWNVLRGEMSLVGPRPIVEDEIPAYGNQYASYKRVAPGLTGLWQVSGRSMLSYRRRVELDGYYVRNWSPWLDIYLLVRTVSVVLRGEGAV